TQSRFHVFVPTILRVVADVLRFVSSMSRSRAELAAENLFLRKPLALYLERKVKPRRADDATRITLVALSRLIDWRRVLTVLKPDTLIRWHRKGFRLFWRWKSSPGGRPPLSGSDFSAGRRQRSFSPDADRQECDVRESSGCAVIRVRGAPDRFNTASRSRERHGPRGRHADILVLHVFSGSRKPRHVVHARHRFSRTVPV